MIIKSIFSGLALLLTFALFVPYIRGIRRGEVVPHVFSWVIWAFGTFVVFAAQLADGAGVGAWPIGVSASITCYIAYLAFRRRADVGVTPMDWCLFVLALAALPAWAAAQDPLWAVILLTTADLIGFGPTLRRAYAHPYQEHLGFFALGALRNLLVLFALQAYTWATVLFPAAVGLACLWVAMFLWVRRRTVARTRSG